MSQDKEREGFEAHEQRRTGRKPLTWDEAYKPEPVPQHVQGKYLIKADQQAWEAWQARAALATQPPAVQGEPRTDEKTPMDRFESAIIEVGVVSACEWFGHAPDSEFTKETIRILAERAIGIHSREGEKA